MMSDEIDYELQQLAGLALRNAFWKSFSALCNAYLEAAEGLELEDLEMQLGELASIYGRGTKEPSDEVEIGIRAIGERYAHTHSTILDAFLDEKANAIDIRGERVFERIDGEWRYVN